MDSVTGESAVSLLGSDEPSPVELVNADGRSSAVLGVLARSGEFTVGDNAPYPIDDEVDYTIPVHGEGRGLPSVMVEIRQDEIRTTTGAAAWAARLAESYRLIEAGTLCILGASFNTHSASDPS